MKAKTLTIHNTHKLTELYKGTYTIKELHSDTDYLFTITETVTKRTIQIIIDRELYPNPDSKETELYHIGIFTGKNGWSIWEGLVEAEDLRLVNIGKLIPRYIMDGD